MGNHCPSYPSYQGPFSKSFRTVIDWTVRKESLQLPKRHFVVVVVVVATAAAAAVVVVVVIVVVVVESIRFVC